MLATCHHSRITCIRLPVRSRIQKQAKMFRNVCRTCWNKYVNTLEQKLNERFLPPVPVPSCRGGVEDTRLEAKAKDTKKIRGQGQPFQGQTLSRPRKGMLEAKAKDEGHKRKCSPKKKKRKVFTKIFQAISTKKRFPKNFSSASKNFNNSKNTAVLEPSTGQFSRT